MQKRQEKIKTKMNKNEFGIMGIFPTPIYYAKMEEDFDPIEKKEIEDTIKEGMAIYKQQQHATTPDSYIFDTKLKKIKEFCESHIDNYVKEVLNPKNKMDFYITQSWLNVIKPGGSHNQHMHPNSIISGVFYISTIGEEDSIWFYENDQKKQVIKIQTKETNPWNSDVWNLNVGAFDLLLFPSSTMHAVGENETTKDRISISFNTFARGTLGEGSMLTELVLK